MKLLLANIITILGTGDKMKIIIIEENIKEYSNGKFERVRLSVQQNDDARRTTKLY